MPFPKDDSPNLDRGSTALTDSLAGAELNSEADPESSPSPEPSERYLARRRWWSLSLPAWLVSMLIHIAMLLFMAAYHTPEVGRTLAAFVVKALPSDETSELLEDFAIEDAMEVASPEELSETPPTTAPQIQDLVSETPLDLKIEVDVPAVSDTQLSNLLTDKLASSLSGGELSMKQALTSRSKQSKRDLLDRYGGNDDTEKAVAAALKWLSQHQLPDGSWSFAHGLACGGKCKDNGEATAAANAATGLALMTFLGAGQTHLEGEYREAVFKGLAFLIRNMKVTEGNMPSWYNKGRGSSTGVMYSHGIASIAMCEAYGMTKDLKLRPVAQASVNFIVYAQDPSGGGWYYSPRAGGDTSVVGWQLMALKSAVMSGLAVPAITLKKADRYLDSVSSGKGSAFGYRKSGDRPTVSAMTACGLLCKMYMGIPKDNEGLSIATQGFLKKGYDPRDIYFSYYATQVMKQVGGSSWTQWDATMKKALLSTQEKTGHAAGSWYDKSAKQADVGGRLYQTTMSAMMLEVYYRYMPIYGLQTEEEAFKL